MKELLRYIGGFILMVIYIFMICFVGENVIFWGNYLYPTLILVFSLPVIASFFAIRYWRVSGVLLCLLYVFMMTITFPIILGWGNLNARYRGVPMFFIVMKISFTFSLITSVLGGFLALISKKFIMQNHTKKQ